MKNYILQIFVIAALFVSTSATARFNDVADQYLEINISYDRSTGQFYDIYGSGSELFELSVTDSGELPTFKLKHGRDGYIGVAVPNQTQIRYNSSYVGEIESLTLVSAKSGHTLTMDVGKGDTLLWMPPFSMRWHTPDSGGCDVNATTHTTNLASEMVSTDVNGVFNYHWCLSDYYLLKEATFPLDINQVGYIDRHFRVSRAALESAPYDSYTHSFSIITTESMRINDTLRGREAYHYTINFHIKPNLQQFDIDSSILDLDVQRVAGRIIGMGQTGYTASGSFDKYQPFTITISSLNSCDGLLCMTNGTDSIPYTAQVFDPVTLLKKPIINSGGSVIINSDKEHEMNGTVGFKFDVTDTGQSGIFTDVAIVRLALVL